MKIPFFPLLYVLGTSLYVRFFFGTVERLAPRRRKPDQTQQRSNPLPALKAR
jgi:hypothetical protein